MIGIEITNNWVLGVELRGSARDVRATATMAEMLPVELTLDNAVKFGSWLKERLAERDFHDSDAVVVLGRSLVTLKTLKLPVCPEEELPEMIRLTVEADWPQMAADQLTDFQAGVLQGDEREILVAFAPKVLIETLTAAFKEAGLALKRITLASIGVRLLIDRLVLWTDDDSPSDQGPHGIALLTESTQAVEMSIWTGPNLRQSRPIKLPAEDETPQRFGIEIRRSLAAFHAGDSAGAIHRVACSLRPQLNDEITKTLPVPATTIPLDEVVPTFSKGPRSWLVPSVGAAWAELLGKAPPLDLLNPKKPPAADQSPRRMAIMGGSLAAVVLLGVGFFAYRQIAAQEAQIRERTEILAAIRQETTDLRTVVERYQSIDAWNRTRVEWLPELVDLAATFPDTSKAYLTNLDANSGQSGQPATISMTGWAENQKVVTDANLHWAQDGGHYPKVTTRGVEPSSERSLFAWRFATSVSIDPMKPDIFVKKGHPTQVAVDEGKVRVPVALVGSKPQAAPEGSSNNAVTVSSSSRSSGTSNSGSSRSQGSSEEGGSALSRMVTELRSLSYEEREDRIRKAPRALQETLRRMVKENRP